MAYGNKHHGAHQRHPAHDEDRETSNVNDSEDCKDHIPNQPSTTWPGGPLPLTEHVELPRFPVESLSGWLRDWVEAEAEATQTPVDLPAMLALTILAACCAPRFQVRVRNDWCEPMNVFVAVALDPGNRKTAVMRDACVPLDEHERALRTQLDSQVKETASRLRLALKRRDAAETAAARARRTDPDGAYDEVRFANAAVDAAERALVSRPVLATGDATQEGLARLLSENGECIALLDAEGCGPIEIMLGRYSDGATAIDLYLRGHAGDTFRSDRATRAPIRLNAPAITMGLAMQPETLLRLGERRELRGAGLLARVLWSKPESMMGRRAIRPRAMPREVAGRYAEGVRTLLRRPPLEAGERCTILLSDAADDVMAHFQAELEPQLGTDGALAHMADWAGKLAGAVARLSGLLHAAEHVAGPEAVEVSADTVTRAIAIGEYLLQHAQVVFTELVTSQSTADAKRLLTWIDQNNVKRFSQREAFNSNRLLTSMDRVRAALAVLADHAWIRPLAAPTSSGPGRHPSPAYEVHPDSQNTQNGARASETKSADNAFSARFGSTLVCSSAATLGEPDSASENGGIEL